MQDEGIGGQLEPEMGGAAAPAHPQQPRTYADRIAMGAHTTSCGVCLLAVATYISDKCILHCEERCCAMSNRDWIDCWSSCSAPFIPWLSKQQVNNLPLHV